MDLNTKIAVKDKFYSPGTFGDESISLSDVRETIGVPQIENSLNNLSAFDGNRAVKRNPFAGINLGVNSLKDFLDKLFFPHVPATLTLDAIDPVEAGSIVSPKIKGGVTPNDDEITTRMIEANGEEIETFDQNVVDQFLLDEFDQNANFRLKVQTAGESTLYSNVQPLKFVYPMFYGVSENPDLGGIDLYEELTKLIREKSDVTTTFNDTDMYIYFAYPYEYPILTAIADANGFNVLESFQNQIAAVESSALDFDWTHNYRIYRSKSRLLADPLTLQFKFGDVWLSGS